MLGQNAIRAVSPVERGVQPFLVPDAFAREIEQLLKSGVGRAGFDAAQVENPNRGHFTATTPVNLVNSTIPELRERIVTPPAKIDSYIPEDIARELMLDDGAFGYGSQPAGLIPDYTSLNS